MSSARGRLPTRPALARTGLAAALALTLSLLAAHNGARTLISLSRAASRDQPAAAHGTSWRWARCGGSVPRQFQCATTKVPLDYRHPGSRKIQISLLRLRAAKPRKRIDELLPVHTPEASGYHGAVPRYEPCTATS